MNHEPQIAATQDKNYLKTFTPLIFAAAILTAHDAHSMAMRPYVNLTAQPRRAQSWSQYTKPQAAQAAPSDEEPAKKAEDKNIDSEDQANQDSVREAIPLWERKSANYHSWSEHVYRELPELGPALLAVNPLDAKIFCPNYANLATSERKQFWAFFISTMVKFESNFDPKEAYTEGFRDSSGRYVVSRGLLQLSLESSKGYRCGFSADKQLHDPMKNLSCGIVILNHWMKKDARIASRSGLGWRGGARYWSVLRAGRKTSYQSIVKWSNSLPFCKL